VHTNRLRHRYVPGAKDPTTGTGDGMDVADYPARMDWSPPEFDHVILPTTTDITSSRYSQRQCRSPDRYTP